VVGEVAGEGGRLQGAREDLPGGSAGGLEFGCQVGIQSSENGGVRVCEGGCDCGVEDLGAGVQVDG
jgi:hypothetical protein